MGAGASFCCAVDERKNSFKAYISNLHLTGVDGLDDLTTYEPAQKYKNQFEHHLKLTRDGLILFYDDMQERFSRVRQESNFYAKVNIKVIPYGAGLHGATPLVL